MTTTRGEGRPIDVLLVDDSPGDVRLTQETFRDANGSIHVYVASDGLEAMAFLRQTGAHVHAPRPGLILLDLDLPKLDGPAVLALIKKDAALKAIPVVVLTTSGSRGDILRAYCLHANCYLTKPVDLTEFLSVVKSIADFWLTTVKLPREAAA